MNFKRISFPIISAISFLFCQNSEAQTIKITSAKIETSIVNEHTDVKQMKGQIFVEFEIENPTTDTLYLFKRAVEPFIEKYPFQLSQNIDMKKFDENCKSIFIYFRPPSMYHFEPFNYERDVLKIAPGNKFVSFSSYDAQEGLCAENIKKIEVQLTYELVKSDFSPEEKRMRIDEHKSNLQLLKALKEALGNDKNPEKLKEIEESIENVQWSILQLEKRIEEFNLIEKTPFYSEKILSNSVYLNE